MQPHPYKTLGTHSGVFHADEVHGAMLLLNYVQEYKGSHLIRTREQSVLDTLDIVIDVGGQYDFEKRRFDHHQRGFQEFYDPEGNFGRVKLSASGLVFKHFGEEIIRNSVASLFEESRMLGPEFRKVMEEKQVKALCRKMYDRYFQYLDGKDNGQNRIPKNTKVLYR